MAGARCVAVCVVLSHMGKYRVCWQAKDELRNRVEKLLCGATSLVGWSNAAPGYWSTEGKCRLGYVIGLTSSSLTGHPNLPGDWIGAAWVAKFKP